MSTGFASAAFGQQASFFGGQVSKKNDAEKKEPGKTTAASTQLIRGMYGFSQGNAPEGSSFFGVG